MRFWLITVGEPIPLPGGGDRLWRTGLLARHLRQKGHDVTWWTSAVDHFRKRFHPVREPVFEAEDGYTIRLLAGRLYRRNISIARFRNHRETAARFRNEALALPRPDLVLCSLPTIELSVAATDFGLRTGTPVILDLRDPWPDVYYQILPRGLRRFGPLMFLPFVRDARRALRRATALLAVSQSYLDWGLTLAGRARRPSDAVITHGYPTPPPVAASQVEDLRRSLAIPEAASVFWFVGSFAWTYDLGTVIQAARGLAHRTDVYFVLSGTGDREQAWRTQAAGLPNVRFTGWVDRHTIAVLGRMATAGLLAYVPDAPNSLTNKLFEYLSAGLPVLAGLGGEAQALVRQWGCGLPYRPGDPADLKRVVLALVDDPPLRARLAAGSRHAFATAFSEEVIYPRLVRYLEEQVTANARS